VILNIGVALWFTPYLVGVLGVAVFGVATLATAVATYMGIIDSALNKALGRFLTIELRQGRFEAANRTFNTALGLSISISLILLPIVAAIAFLAPHFFNVPPAQESAARWLFAATLVSYLLMFTRSVFTTSPFAANRLDLQNAIQAAGTIVRVAMTVALLSFIAPPSLRAVGTSALLGMIVSVILAWLVMRRLTPQLTVNIRDFDRTQLNVLFGVSSWVFINEVGSLLSLNIDQIVVNIRLGAESQGAYALALQWSLLLLTLGRTISTATAPMMMLQFAAGRIKDLEVTSRRSVKYLGLLMALPVGLIVGLSRPLLNVWVGAEFESLSLLLRVIVFPLCIYTAVVPLFTIQVAYNRLKLPAFVSLCTGIVNLALALWWVGYGRMGLGVAIASAVALAFRFVIFTPFYSARIQSLPWYTYYPTLLLVLMAAGSTALVANQLAGWWVISNWLSIIGISALIAVVYALLVYTLVLPAAEQLELRALIVQRFPRR
jgi:membrane protein EpsK